MSDYNSHLDGDTKNPVTILHLSDLHFGIEKSKWGGGGDRIKKIFRLMLADFNYFLEDLIGQDKTWKPDIILITGDLGYSGKQAEYNVAKLFIDHLLDISGLIGRKDRLVICPGNHDFDQDKTKGNSFYVPEIAKFETSRLFQSLNDGHLRNIEEPFEEFKKFLQTYGIPPYDYAGQPNFLMGYRDLLGLRFGIFNSAWFSHLRSEAQKELQLQKIGMDFIKTMSNKKQLIPEQEFDNSSINIAAFHHPKECLFDGEGAYAEIEKKHHLILTGHIHGKPREGEQETGGKAFSCGAIYGDAEYYNNFQLLKIDRISRKMVRRVIGYDFACSRWEEDTDKHKVHYLLKGRNDTEECGEKKKHPIIETLNDAIGHYRLFGGGHKLFDMDLVRFSAEEKELSDTIFNDLKSPGSNPILLYGPSASGKTMFVFQLGRSLQMELKELGVFYCRLNGGMVYDDVENAINSISANPNSRNLLILDNCHLNAALTYEIYENNKREMEFFLVAENKWERENTGIANISSLIKDKIIIERGFSLDQDSTKQKAEGIISRYKEYYESEFPRYEPRCRLSVDVGEIDSVIGNAMTENKPSANKKSKSDHPMNLNMVDLYLALEFWPRAKEGTKLSDIDRNYILEELRKRFLSGESENRKERFTNEIITNFTNIFMERSVFEVLRVTPPPLLEEDSAPRKSMEFFANRGMVSYSKGDQQATFFHSHFAELLILAYLKEKSVDDYYFEIMPKYITKDLYNQKTERCAPCYRIKLLDELRVQKKHADLYKRLISDEVVKNKVIACLQEEKQCQDLQRFLYGVFDVRATNIDEYLKELIIYENDLESYFIGDCNKNPIYSIARLMLIVGNVDELTKEYQNKISEPSFIQTSFERSDFGTICHSLSLLKGKAGKGTNWCAKILDLTDETLLIDKGRSEKYVQLYMGLKQLNDIDPSKAKKVYSAINTTIHEKVTPDLSISQFAVSLTVLNRISNSETKKVLKTIRGQKSDVITDIVNDNKTRFVHIGHALSTFKSVPGTSELRGKVQEETIGKVNDSRESFVDIAKSLNELAKQDDLKIIEIFYKAINANVMIGKAGNSSFGQLCDGLYELKAVEKYLLNKKGAIRDIVGVILEDVTVKSIIEIAGKDEARSIGPLCQDLLRLSRISKDFASKALKNISEGELVTKLEKSSFHIITYSLVQLTKFNHEYVESLLKKSDLVDMVKWKFNESEYDGKGQGLSNLLKIKINVGTELAGILARSVIKKEFLAQTILRLDIESSEARFKKLSRVLSELKSACPEIQTAVDVLKEFPAHNLHEMIELSSQVLSIRKVIEEKRSEYSTKEISDAFSRPLKDMNLGSLRSNNVKKIVNNECYQNIQVPFNELKKVDVATAEKLYREMLDICFPHISQMTDP